MEERQNYNLGLSVFAPPVSATCWDWCCTHLRLRNSRWDPRRAGLMRHWYEIATARISGKPLPHDPCAHRTEELYLVLIAQLAKTTFMQSVFAWVMACHPREMAWYVTRTKDAKTIRKRGIVPMIENTHELSRLLPEGIDARESALGQDVISLGANLLYMLNANLLNDLRSLALPLIAIDEFNRLVEDIEEEGDPIDLAKVRQRTIPHDRLLMGSTTPGAVNGHGWRRLRSGSHERPLVKCQVCDASDYLDDKAVVSGTDKPLAEYPTAVIIRERLARVVCRHCGALHGAATVRQMVTECIAAGGQWVPGVWEQDDARPDGQWMPLSDFDQHGRLLRIVPPDTVIRSGWANALYSPDVTLDSFAATMVAKLIRGKESEKKTWTNCEACRPWINQFTPKTTDEIAEACLDYAHGSCPESAEWLVLVFDQQGNQAGRMWYPWVLRAWQPGVGSWLVACGKSSSDAERDAMEEMSYPIGNEHRPCDLVVIDCANPNFREAAYRWAAEKVTKRICVRGDVRLQPGETWREVPPPDPKKPSRTNRPHDVHEYRIHPHHWRDELEQAINGKSLLPWHLPGRSSIPDYYLKSLNSEDRVIQSRRIVGGGMEDVAVWIPRVTSQTDDSTSVRKDTHWADCEKIHLAIADIFGFSKVSAKEHAAEAHEPQEERREDHFAAGVW